MFDGNASATVKGIFQNVKKIIDASGEEAFAIIQQINIGEHHDYDGWERTIKEDIKRLYSEPHRVYDFLMRQVSLQSARMGVPHKFTQQYLFDILTERGFHNAPVIEEEAIIKQFKVASQIGRNYDAKIGGQKIYRDEVLTIMDSIREGNKSILVNGKKGCGKTWVLLEVADQIERSDSYGLLFIKGDYFDDIESEEELMNRLNFKFNPSVLVSRFSEYRHVVVIIDSLDTLSLARDQKPLKTILSFIDKLLALENVATVIACRDFDLEYDPYLRNRSWDKKIPLPPLNYERDIVPILQAWGINTDAIKENQKALFSHPQNLKLYEKLYEKCPPSSFLTEFHFAKLFIEESVEKKDGLGERAVKSLQAMSKKLLEARSLFLPRLQFSVTEEMFHILCSEDILVKDPLRDRVAFSHQTLLDYLIVRYYVSESKLLLEFILDHHQLPFIRPAIRSFLLYLHSIDGREFSKEVLRILKEERVAYHVKRLIVESLSEITSITENEFTLVNHIYKDCPDFFIRFLQRVTSIDWFDAMHPRLSQAILGDRENSSTKITLLYVLERWMNNRPDKVIECWKYVLSTPDPLFGPIIMMINNFSKWETEGIEDILRALLSLEKNKTNDRWVGRAISKYVAETNKGDDLLWQYITQDIPEGVIPYTFFYSHDKGLNCSEHNFYEKNFLFERLKKSSWLLEIAIDAINDWSSRYEYHADSADLNTAFLSYTSWERTHNKHDHYGYYSINALLEGINHAIILHAKEKSKWFLEIEPSLRRTKKCAVAYFLVHAYAADQEEYSLRAYEFILRPEILFDSQLSDELGELINGIVPFLLPELQEILQKIILERKKPDRETEDQPRWLFNWQYQKLSVIPSIFRLPEAQAFIETWQNTFGAWPQPPKLIGWGGMIGSPISVSEMEGLSLNGLIKLFSFYSADIGRGGWSDPFDHSKGGSDEIAQVFSTCVQKEPGRYIPYMDLFWESKVSGAYIHSLLRGVSDHIRFRFGNLQKPNELEFFEPLIEGEVLAESILTWLDNYATLLDDGNVTGNALYAISYVIRRDDLKKRFLDYCNKMSGHSNPEKLEQKIFSQGKTELNEDDLMHIAFNSVRGVIAEAITVLMGRLLENEEELPEKLFNLFEQFAVDPVEAVRTPVLRLLPFLEFKRPGKGWALFEKTVSGSHPALWPHAYGFLYHQYREHFDKVSPLLDRIKEDGNGKHGAESWGLIMALCVLDDLILLEAFINQLTEFAQDEAWRGAVKVFTANLKTPALRNKCINGLIGLMSNENFPHQLIANIEMHFEEIPLSCDDLTKSYLALFIDKVGGNHDIHYLADLFTYLSRIADSYPGWCMDMVENFLSGFPDRRPAYMWKAEDMVTTVIQLLRWADAQDDPQLITRVIKIQDRLLQLEWPGMDEAFSKAERE
ncbi:MAG: AAA family ATPase [Thermodesulfovibrionales bacterium]